MERALQTLSRRSLVDPGDRFLKLKARRWKSRIGREVKKDVLETADGSGKEIMARQFRLYAGSDPHEVQQKFLDSLERFTVAVAGVQSGKTTSAAVKFCEKIITENNPNGLYWMVAPDSIVGRSMRERFNAMMPSEWIVKPEEPNLHTFVWFLKNGARVEFRSAERPEKLVSATINGMWLDEFTIMKKKAWAGGLRQRLAATGGWAIFSGTPQGRNWSYEQVWRQTQKEDDKYQEDWSGFTWHSSANPKISDEEIASAKASLPEAYYKREFEASWDTFHGQIFGDVFSIEKHVKRIKYPKKDIQKTIAGCDWGFSVAGCIVLCRKLKSGVFYFFAEIYEAGKLPEWWAEAAKEYKESDNLKEIYSDPSRPENIVKFKQEGLRCRKAPNAVNKGIKEVASLFKQDKIIISPDCVNLIREINDYQWVQDSQGNQTEKPLKENDHSVDSVRYCIMGAKRSSGVKSSEAKYA